MGDIYYIAAGGVVIHDGKALLLDRPGRGEVRLPKGHVEPGEEPAQAALREVREEAGYVDLTVLADLGTQRVQFFNPYEGEEISRDEHYFLMALEDHRQAPKDAHDQQFHPIWMPLDEAADRLTFESEREFLRRAITEYRRQTTDDGRLTSTHRDALIESLARWLTDLGMVTPAIFLLEAHRPLSFLASQVLLLAQPLLGQRARDYAFLLEDRENIERILERLEALRR